MFSNLPYFSSWYLTYLIGRVSKAFQSIITHILSPPPTTQEITANLAFAINKILFSEYIIEKYLNNSLLYHSIQPFNESLHSGILLKEIFQFLEHCDRIIYHVKRKKKKRKPNIVFYFEPKIKPKTRITGNFIV